MFLRYFQFIQLLFPLAGYYVHSQESLKIGNQTWMVKNLDVSNFRNGDPIKRARSLDEWVKAAENS